MRSPDRNRMMVLAGAVIVCGGMLLLAKKAKRYDLRGRVVLVTGGSRGLGLLLAREFARRGARVAICARDAQELERAQDNLESQGARIGTFVCDVTQPGHIDAVVGDVVARFGRIDVLVNNAGIIQVGPAELMTQEDFEAAMATHFWGPLHATFAALPHMRAHGGGRIVNIASIGGKISVPHLLPYSASKFALVGLSEGLRAELAAQGIAVTTVCPGLMRTGSPRHARFKGKHAAEYAWFSISDSLPFLSVDSDAAARRIVDACVRGETELVVGLPFKAAARFHGLFPGLTQRLMTIAARMLPGPGGIGRSAAEGKDSQSRLSPSWLTRLGDEAALRNNQ